MTAITLGPSPERTAVLNRRVRLLVGGVLIYNVAEAAFALTAGVLASSTALIGFGLDSIVEVVSALAITWQYAHHTPTEREHTALRVVAYSFFALAAYVTFDAITSLAVGQDADHSTLGLTLTAVSLALMSSVSYWERRTGRELGSASVIADSKQTLLCTYLSAIVFGGAATQLDARMGLGRPGRRARDRDPRREGRPQRSPGRRVLPPASALITDEPHHEDCCG